jgi:rare lipoprotein A
VGEAGLDIMNARRTFMGIFHMIETCRPASLPMAEPMSRAGVRVWSRNTAAAVLLAAGCAPAVRSAPELPPQPPGFPQVGIASWYGPGFHGRTTASGETFDQDALTAAHPSLPFETRVRVINLENRREVVLRINDRGPYHDGRIIDVSRAAARVLGLIGSGTARVRVFVIGAS